MNKKEIIIIAAAVLVVALGVGIYYFGKAPAVNNNGGVPAGNASGTVPASGLGGGGLPSSTTATVLPTGVAVPAQNASSVPAGVAAPTVVAPGSPSGVTSYRSFDLKLASNAFTPNIVIVKLGDTVRINFTSVDGNYDFTQPDYGVSLAVAKGATGKFVQFDANLAGKFTFYCTSCGGPAKGPTGFLEVVK